jgi:hypothetical protein
MTDFDVGDLLGNLFGGGPVVPEVIPEAATPAVAVPGPGDDVGRFADWVRRPDARGRMGWEAPDLPEAVDVDALPGPGCSACGSLESWIDTLGRQRCGVCERDTLVTALKWADKATEMRLKAQQRKSTPGIAPGCVSCGSGDTLDLGTKRPTQGRLPGLCGV